MRIIEIQKQPYQQSSHTISTVYESAKQYSMAVYYLKSSSVLFRRLYSCPRKFLFARLIRMKYTEYQKGCELDSNSIILKWHEYQQQS